MRYHWGMLRIDIITIFPKMFEGPFSEGIIARAIKKEKLEIYLHDLRKWTTDNHQTVDDHPFGGGAGMVLMIEPLYKAITEVRAQGTGNAKVIVTSAKGKVFKQATAMEYSKLDQLIIVCGRYEGIDQRVIEELCDDEVSVGEFVLSGGELPAMIIADSVIRLVDGVLGNEESTKDESYTDGETLEYPQYTRPAEFATEDGQVWKIPEVLLTGNHGEIEKWRLSQKKKNPTA